MLQNVIIAKFFQYLAQIQVTNFRRYFAWLTWIPSSYCVMYSLWTSYPSDKPNRQGVRIKQPLNFLQVLTATSRWKYRFSSEHRSQTTSSPVSTWMGDRLGIPGAVSFYLFHWILLKTKVIKSQGVSIKQCVNFFQVLTATSRWKYRFSSEHRSQTTSSPVSTWMGDRLGIPGAVSVLKLLYTFFVLIAHRWSKVRPPFDVDLNRATLVNALSPESERKSSCVRSGIRTHAHIRGPENPTPDTYSLR